jgi:putative heme iron utilization protein
VKTRLLKKHRQSSQAYNKRSLTQGQVMHNNQKGLKRLEEMILALVVREKNTNIAMVDESYYCWCYNHETLSLATPYNNR